MINKESIATKVKGLFKGDRVIWMVVVFLVLISLLVVYTSSEQLANRFKQNNSFILFRHFVMIVMGLVVMVIAANINYKRYSRILLLLFWISVPLLLFTMLFGRDVNNAQRGIAIFGISFQTSDMAKVALIGFLARILTLKRDSLDDLKELIKYVMLPILVVVGLIFKDNFSTAAMLFVSCIVVMFLSRVKMKYILEFVGAVMGVGIVAFLILLLINASNPGTSNRSKTWANRIEHFFGSSDEAQAATNRDDNDFQVIQSKIAISTGGLIGKGPGKSTQRNILPHPYSDFIYAIIIEEYGLVGGLFVLVLYLVLLYRATRIMIRAPQSYGALLAMGLAFSVVFQAMLNMGVAVGLLPVTGQPLPFVSMGGTSLLFTGLSIGIIISVSKEINKDKNDERDSEIEVAEVDS